MTMSSVKLTSYPAKNELQSFFQNSIDFFGETMTKKIYDINVLKSSNINPHCRELQINNVHRLLFESAVGKKFKADEKSRIDDKHMEFIVNSIKRIYSVVGKNVNLVKVTKSGDITLAAPWGVLNDDVPIPDMEYSIEKNTFVGLLDINETLAKVFVPCGGPDPDSDEILPWVEQVNISDICIMHDESLITLPGEGLCQKIDSGDINFLALRGQFEENDIVVFNKERVHVYALGVYFMDDRYNSVRVKKPFKYQHKPQSFKIKRIPTLQGKTLEIDRAKVSIYRTFDFKLKNINKFGIGTTVVSYHNFCFNSVGFMTHDTVAMDL